MTFLLFQRNQLSFKQPKASGHEYIVSGRRINATNIAVFVRKHSYPMKDNIGNSVRIMS